MAPSVESMKSVNWATGLLPAHYLLANLDQKGGLVAYVLTNEHVNLYCYQLHLKARKIEESERVFVKCPLRLAAASQL